MGLAINKRNKNNNNKSDTIYIEKITGFIHLSGLATTKNLLVNFLFIEIEQQLSVSLRLL